MRPSLIVFALYVAISLSLVGFGAWTLMVQHEDGGTLAGYGVGLVSLGIGAAFGRNTSELCSVRIDDEGIDQWKIARGRRLFFRDHIRWKDSPTVIDDGIRAIVKHGTTEIRINLSFFDDMQGVFEIIERLAGSEST